MSRTRRVLRAEMRRRYKASQQQVPASDSARDEWARKQGFKSYAAFVDDRNRREGGFGYLEDDEE